MGKTKEEINAYMREYNRRLDVRKRDKIRRGTQQSKEKRRLYNSEYRKRPYVIERMRLADEARKKDPTRIAWKKEYDKQARWKSYHKSYGKFYHLKKNYGITAEEYREILESQNGLCAICGLGGDLAVDHDHDTGKIRGLIHKTCNSGLGMFRDDPSFLRAAANYLDSRNKFRKEA